MVRKVLVRCVILVVVCLVVKCVLVVKLDVMCVVLNGVLNGYVQLVVVLLVVDVVCKICVFEVDGEEVVVCFVYWDKVCVDFVKCDWILKKLILKFGFVYFVKCGDLFVMFVCLVVGQQILVLFVQLLWVCIEDVCLKFVLQLVIWFGVDKLIVCGLLKCKMEYIFDFVQYFVLGVLYVDKWMLMDDEDVIVEFMQICGISCWMVEMFLIFNLLWLDVLLFDDLGLICVISVNYFSGEFVMCSEVCEVVVNWELWCIVVIWYMWCSFDVFDVDV